MLDCWFYFWSFLLDNGFSLRCCFSSLILQIACLILYFFDLSRNSILRLIQLIVGVLRNLLSFTFCFIYCFLSWLLYLLLRLFQIAFHICLGLRWFGITLFVIRTMGFSLIEVVLPLLFTIESSKLWSCVSLKSLNIISSPLCHFLLNWFGLSLPLYVHVIKNWRWNDANSGQTPKNSFFAESKHFLIFNV